MRSTTKQLEKSKHELGEFKASETHYADSGTRFYTVELILSRKAQKANPKMPVYLSCTDGVLANAKANLARELERYGK